LPFAQEKAPGRNRSGWARFSLSYSTITADRTGAIFIKPNFESVKHLDPAFGRIRAVKFSSKHIRQYIEDRKNQAANATINRELALVRRAFNLGALEDPPRVHRVPRIPKLREDNIREGFLELQEYRLILNGLTEPIKPVFVVAYHLGMRTGELLALKRDWVDLREGLIYVNGRVTKNKKPKLAPIYGEMGPWLEMALGRAKIAAPSGKLLFTWEDGRPIRDFRAAWDKACTAAGLPGLLFHDLRRTAVRNMIRAGVPEKTAMAVSGHKTASMLWRYNILDARDIQEAGRRTERYLEQQKTQLLTEKPTEYSSAKPS
jgi:integrase